MTMALTIPDAGTLPAKFSPSDVAIAQLADAYMPLTIRAIDDSEGFSAVHAARMVVKGHRVDVEKTRKKLKEDALVYGRLVDGEAKRLTGLLEPIEAHLQEEEERVTAERERIKHAARIKAEEEARAKAAAEAAAVKAEQERLAEERRRLDAQRETLEVERRALQERAEAEARRVAELEQARQRAAELEQAKAEASSRATRETEARIAREAAEKARSEREQEAARQREEAMRPDRDKLLAVAMAVKAIPLPSVSAGASGAAQKVGLALVLAGRQIRSIAKGVGHGPGEIEGAK